MPTGLIVPLYVAASVLHAVSAAPSPAAPQTAASTPSFFAIEAGIGGSAYKQAPDGYWYQEAFPHTLNLTAPMIEVGITGNLFQRGRYGLDYHLGWAWLGTVHTDVQAVPDDANYNTTTKSCNGPCLPLARFKGSGHDQGFYATLEPHVNVGQWRFGVEAGPYLHRVTWTEDVSDVVRWGQGPYSIHAAYSSGWNLGYVLGASISRGPLTLSYQYFDNSGKRGDEFGPVWTRTQVLLFKYRANVF